MLVAVLVLLLLGCGRGGEEGSGQEATGAFHDYGMTLATSVKHAQKRAYELSVRDAIAAFAASEGRFPDSMEELEVAGYELPEPPEGYRVSYIPETGSVVLEAVE